MSAAEFETDGTMISFGEEIKDIRQVIRAARDDRKRYEPTWQSNLAFASGKFWLKWDRDQRRLVYAPEFYGRDLYSADVITEYRTTALGELGSDDDRPELILRRDDEPSEDFQRILNLAVSWGWDYEWHGDDVLEDMRRICVDLGMAAIRCRFDPDFGPKIADNMPFYQGKPVMDVQQATDLLSNGPNPDVQMRSVNRGRICWDVLTPFNIIVPPGIPNEREFPWECVVKPIPIAVARKLYGSKVQSDADIGSIIGLDNKGEVGDTYSALGSPDGGATSKLRNHAWLFTYYERATPDHPKGRTVTFLGNKMLPVDNQDSLPYQLPDGSWSSGIVYFHWWRVTGRFFSRGLVENMKDVQRSINKRATQKNEIIDRGMPYVIVETNSRAKERRGIPMELLEIDRDERPPQPVQGITLGDGIYRDIESLREDLEHATGIRGPRMGENPAGVTTYAQLALLNENDQLKREQIMREHKNGIAKLVELSVHDMKLYWGSDRIIPIAGEDGRLAAHVFQATQVPEFFMVKVAKGTAKPRTQAAELQKIQDIWAASLASGVVATDPHAWVHWFKSSMDAGQCMELPDVSQDDQIEKARLENHIMLQGQEVPVQYYDPIAVHIPIHRRAQIEAEMMGDKGLWDLIEQHVNEHIQTEVANQAHLQSTQPGAQIPAPQGPPQQGGAPPQQQPFQPGLPVSPVTGGSVMFRQTPTTENPQ